MNRTFKIILFSAIILVSIFVGLNLVRAQTAPELSFTPPCPYTDTSKCDQNLSTSIAAYIKRIYQFGLAISGILAVGMIVTGGLFISISGGRPDRQNEGKEMIQSALWGIALLFGSYLILQTVNPQLVTLHEPQLEQAPTTGFPVFAASSDCPAGLTPNGTDANSCYYTRTQLGISACDLNSPYGALNCTAITSSTNTYCANKNSPYPCVCQNCVVFDSNLKSVTKNESCVSNPSFGDNCLLERNTRNQLAGFIGDLQNKTSISVGSDQGNWRISEAFPPIQHHDDACHYTGTCFDFGAPWGGTFPFSDDACKQLVTVANYAAQRFTIVLIEDLPAGDAASCGPGGVNIQSQFSSNVIVAAPGTTDATAFHLHISFPLPQ